MLFVSELVVLFISVGENIVLSLLSVICGWMMVWVCVSMLVVSVLFVLLEEVVRLRVVLFELMVVVVLRLKCLFLSGLLMILM